MHVFCEPRTVIDRVLRKVLEWAVRKKRISEVLVRSVSLYEGAKSRVRVYAELSVEF